MLFGRIYLIVVLILSTAGWAAAQQDTATVVGVVTDAQQAVIPGVTITAKNVGTGIVRTDVTYAKGRYRVAAIPPGEYEFTAELQGFTTAVRKGVTLTVGSESTLNFEMALGRMTEQLTVTADAPVVETTNSTVQRTYNRDQVDLLPTIGREYTDLIRLSPGFGGGSALAGSRGAANRFMMDGVDNTDDIGGGIRQTAAVESIQELQILVTGFKAEYGQVSGGVINVVSRTGTNTTHGSGFSCSATRI